MLEAMRVKSPFSHNALFGFMNTLSFNESCEACEIVAGAYFRPKTPASSTWPLMRGPTWPTE